MSNANKKPMSWGWIIFWFILFWPVGLYFLFKRLNADKTATLQRSKTVAVIAYVLMGFGAIYLMLVFAGEVEMIAAAIVFGGGGLWVLRISKKMEKKGKKYKNYITLVVNQSQTSIDYIASATGVSYETAVKDLKEMIDAGYFVNAYINEGSRLMILSQPGPKPIIREEAQPQTKVVTCGSCGANNTIVAGKISECEYCGSPLR